MNKRAGNRDFATTDLRQETVIPPRRSFRTRRPAFTLIEMMVAVAILLGVMAMVGMIFQTAGKASGQAQSFSIANRETRNASTQLKLDLEGCHPGVEESSTAVMAIVGNEVAAYVDGTDAETQRFITSGYVLQPSDLHRTDVLVFTTTRDVQTYVFRTDANPSVQLDPVTMVTYGHADVGQLEANGPGQYRFSPTIPRQRIESTDPGRPALKDKSNALFSQSDIPSRSWHLARRIVRFPRTAQANPLAGMWPQTTPLVSTAANPSASPADARFLEGEADLYQYSFSNTADLNTLTNRYNFNFIDFFQHGLAQYAGMNGWYVTSYLKDSQLWWYRADILSGGFQNWNVFTQDHWWGNQGVGSGCVDPNFSGWTRKVAGAPTPCCAPDTSELRTPDLRTAFYPMASGKPTANHRTVLDVNAPAGAASRMGAYFLPHCSDFLVEYTYDDPAEVLLSDDGTGNNWHPETQAPTRWQRVPNGQQIVWSRLSVRPKNYSDPNDPRNLTDPIRWPRALRITMRAWGPGTTLSSPIEQVIVHVFQ